MHPLATATHLRLDINHCKRSFEVVSCNGAQVCSEPYAFELEIISHSGPLDPADLMFVTAYLHSSDVAAGIHGHIQSIERVTDAPTSSRVASAASLQPAPVRYRMTLGPRLGLMAYRYNRRIFQGMSAEHIITQVLSEHGIHDDAYLWQTKRHCVERDYCAQYCESDLQWVQRLCEEEGLQYFFMHSRHRHVVVFADRASAVPPSLCLGEKRPRQPAPVAPAQHTHPLRATVVGALFEPARVDAKGRIMVRFDWSHQGDGARFNQCWLPIDPAIDRAGARWCGGMSVVVGFRDDNPDLPCITAQLWDPHTHPHNHPQHPPQPLAPVRKTVTTRIDSDLFLDDSRQFSTEDGLLIQVGEGSEVRLSVGLSEVTFDAQGISLSGPTVVLAATPTQSDASGAAPQV